MLTLLLRSLPNSSGLVLLVIRDGRGDLLAIAGYDPTSDTVSGWRQRGDAWQHMVARAADVRGRYVDVDTPCRLSDL
jgi:hypothetical protein